MKTLSLIATLLLAAALQGQDSLRLTASVRQTHSINDGIRDWAQTQVTFGFKKADTFTLEWVGTSARRFALTDYATKIDLYWTLLPKMYIHSNVGLSRGAFLPRYRYHLEAYGILGRSEFSLGYRHMSFDQPVHLFTGSISYYWGRHWTALRIYGGKQHNFEAVSPSYSLKHRRYWSRKTYIEVELAIGKELSTNTENQRIAQIRTYVAGATYQFHLKPLLIQFFARGFREKLTHHTRRRIEIGLGLRY